MIKNIIIIMLVINFIKCNTLLNFSNNQKIIFIKSNLTFYTNSDMLNNRSFFSNDFICKKILNKKILHIAPAGLHGFYDIGICKIIKQRYKLNDYIFNGASAGAWNSLFMVFKYDHSKLIDLILLNLSNDDNNEPKHVQIKIKKIILSNFKTGDFDLVKLFISVCVYENNEFINYVYTDFPSVESAIDCCIASSNIPILTGNFIHRYNNKISFDGAFLNKIHILNKKPHFIIKKSLFGKKNFTFQMFDKKNNISKLYQDGQNDAINNINYLDKFFL